MNVNEQQQQNSNVGRPRFEEGTYTAMVHDSWAMKSSEKNTPAIAIEFQLKDHPRKIVWNGWLTDLAKDRSIETLLNCGFVGAKLSDINYGRKAFTEGKEVDLVLEYEDYKDKQTGETKSSLKVKYVNTGNMFKSKMSEGETVQVFQGLQLEGDFLRIKNGGVGQNQNMNQNQNQNMNYVSGQGNGIDFNSINNQNKQPTQQQQNFQKNLHNNTTVQNYMIDDIPF